MNWSFNQFLCKPVMTDYDRFFAVSFGFSLVIWLFPFMVPVMVTVFQKQAQKL
ncbi:hypothetical protein L208DRAFT_912114 [Tricholoma matsutake]|nr:hypothetical protein L208DRAFT_912114 [Tricholoma matsutake 945]